jgi:hypothetical protein
VEVTVPAKFQVHSSSNYFYIKLCLGIYVNDIAVLTQKGVPTTFSKEHREQQTRNRGPIYVIPKKCKADQTRRK